MAFRPRWSCAAYERSARRGDEPPDPLAWPPLPKRTDRHWQAALAWLQFLPTLTVAEAERAAGADPGCIPRAMKSRPCLRVEIARLRAWRRHWWRAWRGRT
jgi:hypothetical protein